MSNIFSKNIKYSYYFLIITKITSLAHPHRVKRFSIMRTVPSILTPSVLPIATRAHPLKNINRSLYFCIVFSVGVWTITNLLGLLQS